MTYSKLPRIRVHLFGYFFSPGWIPTLVTLILFPFLISLGKWQIHRAEEKRRLEHDFAQQNKPLTIQQVNQMANQGIRYQRLQVTGHFDNNHIMFLDNQTYKQKIGYHVLTPFILENDKKQLLVDRGFVAIQKREDFPLVQPLTGRHALTGLIYYPSKRLVLKKEKMKDTWPLVLETVDMKEVRYLLNLNIYPFYLLELSGENSNFVRDWHPVNFPSYRHTGYAVQWFSLAFLLAVIYISLNISRAK